MYVVHHYPAHRYVCAGIIINANLTLLLLCVQWCTVCSVVQIVEGLLSKPQSAETCGCSPRLVCVHTRGSAPEQLHAGTCHAILILPFITLRHACQCCGQVVYVGGPWVFCETALSVFYQWVPRFPFNGMAEGCRPGLPTVWYLVPALW